MRNALQDQALTVFSVGKKYSNEAKGTVLKQTPRSSLEVPEGTTVELIVAQRFPKVPNVTSKNLTQARRTLRKAGFAVAVRKQNSTTKRDGDIISQNQPGGTEVRPGRTVALVVINNTCRLGYSPCILQGSDVDCAGGSGDGPRYVGTVRVTGSDPYGLDSDNDGIGCE